LLVFLLAQGLGALLMIPFGMQPEQIPTTIFSLILMAVDIFAVLACYFILRNIHLITVSDLSDIKWKPGMLAVAGGILGALCTSILTENVALPDAMMQMSLAMSHNFWGIITLVIVGPVTEELLFREAIEGEMLRRDANPWTAIIVSALAFSIAHFNLAQGLYAFPLAVIFGIIYYKIGNIILTTLLHIINNGIAALQLYILGEDIENISYAEWFGGSTNAYVLMLLCAALSLVLMKVFWDSYPSDLKQQKKALP
jgi:hypothetical protein